MWRILRTGAHVLPIRIERHWQDSAASTPPPQRACWHSCSGCRAPMREETGSAAGTDHAPRGRKPIPHGSQLLWRSPTSHARARLQGRTPPGPITDQYRAGCQRRASIVTSSAFAASPVKASTCIFTARTISSGVTLDATHRSDSSRSLP
jgi:hypothetical protein